MTGLLGGEPEPGRQRALRRDDRDDRGLARVRRTLLGGNVELIAERMIGASDRGFELEVRLPLSQPM